MEEENKLTNDNGEVFEINYNLEGGRLMSAVQPEEKIFITGISGCFPNSNDVHEFRDNLYNKVDMVLPNRRWEMNHPEIPTRSGTIPDIEQYDPGFFGVHERQSDSLDPMIAMLQEKTIEAIFDAGLHPSDLEDTKTGVFVGVCFSENDKTWFFDKLGSKTYAVTGSERSMAAHRLSYFLRLKGPSYTTDTACSSSLYALEQAYRSFRSGEIDNAIVAGINLCLHPFVSLQFARLGVLSKDGSCKAFDEQGNGYARSEAVGVLLLQKAKDAKRQYAEVIHVKTNCDGYKEQGITFPSKDAQRDLMNEFYDECNFDRYSLSFLEAHGTGTVIGDPEECYAIDEVFTQGRTKPLLMGSVKSNIGHSEPASGVCSVIKCIIGMETGIIPPNIHYNKPRAEIKGLVEGRMRVVRDKLPFQDERGLIGINSFGFGGGNCHVLLRWNPKVKVDNSFSRDNVPVLVCVSGRTEQAVLNLLDSVANNKLDMEYVKLLHSGFRKNVEGHIYRGFSIVINSADVTKSTRLLRRFANIPPPLYFIFGDLNNWCKIGYDLMALPAFSDSIKRIQKILIKEQINILDVLLKKASSKNINLLGSVVIQLALVDLFRLTEIKPNGVVGYSFGELISSYCKGLLSLEDTVHYAYVINKLMSDVMKSGKYKENGDRNGNYIIDDNAINGNGIPTDEAIKDLNVMENTNLIQIENSLLQNAMNDSAYFKIDAKKFKHFLKAILCNEYKDTHEISRNSVVLKLADEPLDQLEHVSIIPLFIEGHNNCLQSFLKALGRLYELGYNPQISNLYPTAEFPVSRGTQMISPYIKWNHRKSKSVPKYNFEVEKDANIGARAIKIQINDETWKFVTGHVIDGRNLFPATAYLYFVWEAFSCMKNIRMSMMSVCFENCKFLRATTVPQKGYFTLHASIQLTSGNFEVTEGNTAVVTGKISLLGPNTSENLQGYNFARYTNTKGFKLKSKDIYKELRLRGYNYKGEFRAIEECDCSATNAQIKWEGNWVTFMDNMLQLKILQSDTRLLYVPTFISKLTISAKEHLELVTREVDKGHKTPTLHVRNDTITGTIRGGGINIWGLIATSIPRRKILGVPILETYKFVPNVAALDINQSVRVNTQIILENAQTMKVKAVELIDEFTQKDAVPLSPIVKSALEDQPLIIPYLKILSKTPLEDIDIEVEDKNLKSESDCLLVIASNVLGRPDILKEASNTLVENGFIITRESCKYDNPTEIPSDFTIFTVHRNSDETILMLQKQSKIKQSKYIKISSTQDFHWLSEIQNSIAKESNDKDILLYTENEPKSGILGLVNCLRREPPSKNIRCLFMMDKTDRFNSELPFYTNQLKKHMAVNVYKDGQWGTYRHLPLAERRSIESEHCFANVTVRGDLSSLRWIEGPLRHDVIDEPERQLVHVYYCALNFRDVMTATGKINVDVVTQDRLMQECIQGFEYSGRDRKGNRVMGMIPCGALSTLILDDAYMRFPVLDSWSLEEAATIPVVYSTVIYALIMRGRMVRGESILIHSGTGGVGQAAIRIALHYGCTVFTTVGSQEKRDFLKKTFPQLKDHNIGNSHDESFEQLVYQGTNGRGVDLVLNSLAEEKLVTSVRCLALGGRFIEIGKFDMANNNHLSLLLLEKEASFQGVMLDQLFNDPPRVKKELMAIIIDGIKQGAVKPLTRTVFQYDNLEQAFRFMASGKHMGKVLIQIREPEEELVIPPRITSFTGVARVFCDPDKVYIITGGLGGFGLELADWLILRGARKVVLTSRKGISNGYQNYRINIWKTYGAVVKISKADITTREGCEQLIKESLDLGRIDAIFNLAVVLADGLFENQTAENFVTSFGPKAYATEYLDELTRRLCPDLREFVVFSSVSCGRGNAGQTNYGMSNSVMERICEDRKRAGFPALAIQWGAVGEVGLVAEMLEEDMEIVISGTLQQRISSCLQVMDLLMRQRDASIVSSIVVAEKKAINAANNIVDAVINILGLNDSKSVSLHSTLAELGMDSMTAVEIKQVLERDFEVFLSAKDIRTMTLAKLKEIQNEKLGEDGKDKEVFHIGMEMMFRHIGDETQNSIPYLEMKSNVSENSDAPTLLLFPGIEGLASIYQDLASALNAHTIGLQLTMDSSQKTIVEMAQSVIPIIEEFFPSREFTFISYSYGTLIALEAISILESRGYSGTLIIIDGAPMLMKQMATNLGIESEIMFQTGLICHLLSFYIPLEEITRHKENIFKCETWDERVNLGLEILKNCIIQHNDYYRVVANSIYNRTKFLMDYTPSYKKLRSNIKLFKPSQATAAGLPEDYGLSEYVEKPIEIQTIAGNHVTLVNSEVLAKAINSDLQRTIKNI